MTEQKRVYRFNAKLPKWHLLIFTVFYFVLLLNTILAAIEQVINTNFPVSYPIMTITMFLVIILVPCVIYIRRSNREWQVSDDGISVFKNGTVYKSVSWDAVDKIKSCPMVIFAKYGSKLRVAVPLDSRRFMIAAIEEFKNDKGMTFPVKTISRTSKFILKSPMAILIVFTVYLSFIVVWRGLRLAPLLTKDRVVIAVNYLEKYNKLNKPDHYDPNQNAAPYFDKAFAALVSMPNDIKSIRYVWPGDMNDIELAAVRNWVSANSETVKYLKEAAQKSYYWVNEEAEDNSMMCMTMPRLGNFRTSAHCLSLQARLMAKDGETEPALQQEIGIYKMGMFFAGPKTLINQLVGISVSALAVQSSFQIIYNMRPSSDLLKNFQQQLQSLLTQRRFVMDFTGEKLVFYDSVQRLFTDDGDGDGHIYGARFIEPPAYKRWVDVEGIKELSVLRKKASRLRTRELADKLYEYFGEIANKPPWYFYNEGIDPERVVREMVKDDYFLSLLTPAIVRVTGMSYRLQVHTEGLITTAAILRYKADKGRYPEDLQGLIAANYLEELPIDVFSGKPLVYRRTDNDFILYSFAEDFDDDGGKHNSHWATAGDGDFVFWPVEKIQKETK